MKLFKKISRLSIFISMILLLSFFVAGQSYSTSIQSALKPILDVFAGVFGLTNDPFYGLVLMKVILWLIVLNLFTLAIRRTPMWGDNATTQKNAKIIATLLSLAGVLVIPRKTIEGMFFYIGIVFIVGLVVVIIQMINGLSNNQGSITGGWVGIGIGILMVTAALTLFSVSPYNTTKVFFDLTLFDLMFIAGLGVIIYGIVTLFKGGGNNTTTTNTTTTNTNPRQPNNPPQNNNQMVAQLGAFTQNLQNFTNAINAYNQNYQQNIVPLPNNTLIPLQLRNQVLQLSNNVVTASNVLSQNIANIQSQPQLFQTLSQQQQQQFIQGVNQYLGLYNQHMQDFVRDVLRF